MKKGGVYKNVKIGARQVSLRITTKDRKRHEIPVKLGRAPTKKDLLYYQKVVAGIQQRIADGSFDLYREFPEFKGAKEYARFSPILIKEYAEKFDYSKGKRKSTVVQNNRNIRNWIVKKFGDIPLCDLTPGHLKRAIKAETCSAQTLKNKLAPFKAMLDEAVDDELIPYSPFNSLPSLKAMRRNTEYSKPNKEIDPYTPEEMEQIYSVAGDYKWMIQFAAWSGLRPSEYIALEWSDIDFEARTISVNKNIVQGAGENKGSKTASSVRTVYMNEGAKEALTAQKALSMMYRSKVFLWKGKPFIDPPQARKNVWMPIFKASGVRWRRGSFKNLRHTFASTLFSKGVDIKIVSKQLGHKNIKVTLEAYATLIDKLINNDWKDKMNDFYKERS